MLAGQNRTLINYRLTIMYTVFRARKRWQELASSHQSGRLIHLHSRQSVRRTSGSSTECNWTPKWQTIEALWNSGKFMILASPNAEGKLTQWTVWHLSEPFWWTSMILHLEGPTDLRRPSKVSSAATMVKQQNLTIWLSRKKLGEQ